MPDIWTVENLWSMIKADVAKDHVNSRQDLKKSITRSRRKAHQNKELCRRLMESFPKWYLSVIKNDGNQVHKDDY